MSSSATQRGIAHPPPPMSESCRRGDYENHAEIGPARRGVARARTTRSAEANAADCLSRVSVISAQCERPLLKGCGTHKERSAGKAASRHEAWVSLRALPLRTSAPLVRRVVALFDSTVLLVVPDTPGARNHKAQRADRWSEPAAGLPCMQNCCMLGGILFVKCLSYHADPVNFAL